MHSWLSKFFKAPREIGSVAPSSPALGKLMSDGIAPGDRVLELGSGSGAITEHIYARLVEKSNLTLIELDLDLAGICRNRFPRARIFAEDVESVLSTNDEMYDVIVSGIPFVLMEEQKRERVFRLIATRLKPRGRFVMFQYSLTTKEQLETVFCNVETKFTPWNLPPAFVYVATGEAG